MQATLLLTSPCSERLQRRQDIMILIIASVRTRLLTPSISLPTSLVHQYFQYKEQPKKAREKESLKHKSIRHALKIPASHIKRTNAIIFY